jgi:hypothetical protein
MFTDFFSADDIAAAARRTGFVQRASTLPGTRFLALVTFGTWRAATTTLAHVAAPVPHVDEQGAGSPEASQQRLPPRARALLQDLLPPARAKVHAIETVCDDGLCTALSKGSLADSTGCELPASLQDLLPGSGGSAAKASAKIQAVWDYKSSVFEHFVLTP